jgi:competence protein ComEC
MVVTHADSDHSGGALSVLEAVPVEWLVSSLGVDHPIRRAAARQRPCLAGQSWEWDGVRFDMLHPPPQRDARRKVGSNAGSCVLKVTSAHGSVLLPADIGKQAERRLLKESGEQLAATVLVAPHHGSKTSSSEAFVRQVAPGLVYSPWVTAIASVIPGKRWSNAIGDRGARCCAATRMEPYCCVSWEACRQ